MTLCADCKAAGKPRNNGICAVLLLCQRRHTFWVICEVCGGIKPDGKIRRCRDGQEIQRLNKIEE